MATRVVAILLLLAVCAPYAAAVMPHHAHDDCGMEMCKRLGKCCCKRSAIPGKLQWNSANPCDTAGPRPASFSGPQSAIVPQAWAFEGPVPRVAAAGTRSRTVHVQQGVTFDLFSRPPPASV